MALDLSAFSVTLLVQNQACSDSKQDSRAETCVTMHWHTASITERYYKALLLLAVCPACTHSG